MAGGFRVAECTVEPQLNTLERNGHTIRLEPKVMQVLVCLSERHGELVTKAAHPGSVARYFCRRRCADALHL
jgi:DNA-binding winged helix-turn-helix (wHTH) protein